MSQNPVVTIEMENGSVIKAELYPEIAPNTVNNFLSLVNNGYYDGLTFHRVIYGFMIQGGCPDGTGMGGPGYSIKGEFAKVLPCVLVQFVVESTEHGHIAVEVCFHHVLEDVAHLVVSALLLHCLASSLCHVGRD